jgi:ankyrin repeat protein
LCHKAAKAGNDRLLDWALRALKLQPDLRDKHSRTPLLLAVESGSLAAVCQLLEHLVLTDKNDKYAGSERVVNAMEYANMRSSPLLRAMVDRVERKITIVTSLVEADEKAFGKLSRDRQTDLVDLRTAFYIEALCWAIECDFSAGFTFLLPKISKSALSSRMTLDRDTVFHSAAGAVENDYLKTLLQTLTDRSKRNNIIQVPNAKGKTPLDIAVTRGSLETTELLLRSGAESTPLQMQMVKEMGNRELEALLLRYSSTSEPRE